MDCIGENLESMRGSCPRESNIQLTVFEDWFRKLFSFKDEGKFRIFHCKWYSWDVFFLGDSCLGSIFMIFALMTSAISFFGRTIALSCKSLAVGCSKMYLLDLCRLAHQVFRRLHLGATQRMLILLFSVSDKVPWTDESFRSEGNLNHEWDDQMETTTMLIQTKRWVRSSGGVAVEEASIKVVSHSLSSPRRPIDSHFARHVKCIVWFIVRMSESFNILSGAKVTFIGKTDHRLLDAHKTFYQ
nr:hypothetical protein [Tanacetum cinerariifolium]